MSDQGGVYYCDGFSVEKENGLSSFDEKYLVTEIVNDKITDFSGLDVAAMTIVYELTGSTSYPLYTLMIDSDGDIYQYATSTNKSGALSNNKASACDKPDIFVLPSGNILYTSARYAGLGIRGKCDSTSTTTKIVDADGRDFTSLGVTTSSPNNKVTNLKTGESYTITSISNENATNDALNFTAGSESNSDGDEFIVFVGDPFDLDTGITVPTFKPQIPQGNWARPIRQYGDQYMILNGNYIALIANDESTLDAKYKQLPTGMQGLALEVNGSMILVSAFSSKGVGYLLLWDGFSDGWNEIIPVDYAPIALMTYGNGWVYLANGIVYYTDGRSIQRLSALPDATMAGVDINCWGHNSIAQLNDEFYFAVNTSNVANLNRSIRGVLVFNKNTGFTTFKCKSDGIGFINPQCISVRSEVNMTGTYQPYNDIWIGTESSLCNMNTYTGETDTGAYRSFVYLLDMGQETSISEIWLNLKKTTKGYITESQKSKVADISVSYGSGEDNPLTLIGVGAVTTTTIANSNGASSPGIVGAEIEMLEGDVSGERSFIQSIADAGTSSEVWTMSPAFSTTSASNNYVRMWGLKLGEQKTVNLSDISKPIRFNANFLGSKMYLEVSIRGNANAFPVSIMDIQLF